MDFRCSRLRGPLPGLELQGMSRVVWEVFSLSHVSPLCGHIGSNLLSSHTRGLRTQTQLGLVSSLPFPGLQGAAGRYETSQHDDWYLSKVGKSVLILNPVFPHSADLLSKGTTVWKPRFSYLPYTLVCFTVEGVSSSPSLCIAIS
jgi:hypothetical protein